MKTTTTINVWLDETSQDAGWIVSEDDGESSRTLKVFPPTPDGEVEARDFAATLGVKTYTTIAENGEGDRYSRLERRDDGAICLTTNAETRQPVTPAAYAGPGWDSLDTAEWLDQLEAQFDSREAAEAFVQAAGRDLPAEKS